MLPGGWIDRRPHEPLTREQAIASFINSHSHDIEFLRQIRADLAGRTLMCWCRPDQACHADWLLEVANGPHPLEEFVDRSPEPDCQPPLPAAEDFGHMPVTGFIDGRALGRVCSCCVSAVGGPGPRGVRWPCATAVVLGIAARAEEG